MQSKHLTTFKTKECMTTDSYMEMSFYRTHTPKHITDTHIHTHTFYETLSDSHWNFADEKDQI